MIDFLVFPFISTVQTAYKETVSFIECHCQHSLTNLIPQSCTRIQRVVEERDDRGLAGDLGSAILEA